MNVTRVLALLPLFVVLAHSFSWDIVVGTSKRLKFYKNDTLMHTEYLPSAKEIDAVTYDPVHYRVLFSDNNHNNSISSFDLATRKTQPIVSRLTEYLFPSIAYDPVAQLLFWLEGSYSIYSLSYNPATFKKAVEYGKLLFKLNYFCRDIAVDSCGGYIYWATYQNIERAAFDGSEREVLIDGTVHERQSLDIDQQTRKIYWIEETTAHQFSIESADLNGKNRMTLYLIGNEFGASALAVSKDFIYWRSVDQRAILQLPKNQQDGVEPTVVSDCNRFNWEHPITAANYTIEEQALGTKSCQALKNLIQNFSVPYSLGVEKHNVSTCYNYCFQGNCSVSAEGHPKCSCEAGYSGIRCEVNACHKYCLHGGVCSLSEEEEPVCQCTADYEGERCDVDRTTKQILLEVKQVREDLQCTLQLYSDKLDENAAKIQLCEESRIDDLQNHDKTTSKTQTSNM